MRRLLAIVLPLALLAVGFGGMSYLYASRPELEPAPPRETVWTVSAVEVERSHRRPVLQAFGEIVAGREVVLRPLVEGLVIEGSDALIEGGEFAVGETVLVIDPFEFERRSEEIAAQIRASEAKTAELKQSLEAQRELSAITEEMIVVREREIDRRQQLAARQAGSEAALDESRLLLATERYGLASLREMLTTLEAQIAQEAARRDELQVALRRAERDLEQTRLVAPFGGFVTDVEAALGKRLGVGDAVARLIDAERLEVRFNLRVEDFGRLWEDGLLGRAVTVTWRLGQRAHELDAKVVRVEPAIDIASGGVDVFAELQDVPETIPLRPGAFVEVDIPDRSYDGVVALPADAVFDGRLVYAVRDERLEPVRVEILGRDGRDVIVRGELAEDDRIATTRLAEMGPGLKVRVCPDDPACGPGV